MYSKYLFALQKSRNNQSQLENFVNLPKMVFDGTLSYRQL